MLTYRKQICSRVGTSANYGEACKERFYSLRSASVEVVCSRPLAPQIYFQMCLIIRLPRFFQLDLLDLFTFLLPPQSASVIPQVIKSIAGMAITAFVILPPKKPYQS